MSEPISARAFRSSTETVRGVPESQPTVAEPVLMRAVDLALSVTLGILLSPVALLIAIIVKVDSPGPVLFRQARMGLNGETFQILKFRKFPHRMKANGPALTMANDVRMTRFGVFLERSKLDELPQLWNVFKGEMSFVGFRPETLNNARLFTDEYALLLKCRPGIFGPAQVAYSRESDLYPEDQDPQEFYDSVLFPKKADLTLGYFSKRTVWSDVAMIGKGIWVSLANGIKWRRVITTTLPMMLIDAIAVAIGWTSAHSLRYDILAGYESLSTFTLGAVGLPLIVLASHMLAGIYRVSARYFSLTSAIRLLVSTAIACLIGSVLIIGFFVRDASIMLAPVAMVVAASLMLAARFGYRHYMRSRSQTSSPAASAIKNVAVYGADERGIALAHFLDVSHPNQRVVGLIDDAYKSSARTVGGYRVLGVTRDLDAMVDRHDICEIWLATKPPTGVTSHNLKAWCVDGEQTQTRKVFELSDIAEPNVH